MALILLLAYIAGSVAVESYLQAHPPLFKKGAAAKSGLWRLMALLLLATFGLVWPFLPFLKKTPPLLLLVGLIWRALGIAPWVILGAIALGKPLFKLDAPNPLLTLLDLFWRMGGAVLWLLGGVFWVSLPTFSPAWQDAPIPVPLLLVDVSVGLPLLIFLGGLYWSQLFPHEKLRPWLLLDGALMLLVAVGIGIVWLPAFWKQAPPFLLATFAPTAELSAARLPFLKYVPVFLLFVIPAPLLAAWLLYAWALKVIPTDVEEEAPLRKALTLLFGFFSGSPKPSALIHRGKVRPTIAGSLDGVGTGWLLTEPENVAVLKGRSEIRRIVGPGVAFTHQGESVHSVLDLRPQLRTVTLQAITRDGIKVCVTVTLVFQIAAGRRTLYLMHPWPYARDAIWRAVLATEVNPAGRTPVDAHISRPWSDLPLEMVRHILPQILIEFPLDDLYEIAPEQLPPRQEIGARLQHRLAEQLEPLGFSIETCALGVIAPVEAEVTRQRIAAWQARWIGQLMAWQGAAQARRFAHFAAIRNQARMDLLSHLIEATNATLQQTGGDVQKNLVAYHLLESLEHIARDPEIQTFLPESAAPALSGLRERLEEPPS